MKPARLTAFVILAFLGCTRPDPTPSSGYQGHGAESVSEEVINQFRAPPLPSHLSRHVHSMLDIRPPDMGKVSPDGKKMYFNWSVTGTSQVWKLDSPKGFPQQLTGGEDKTTLESVTADGQFLILSRDRRGEENPGLYLQRSEGGALIPIQHAPKVQTIFEYTSDDSKTIYFSANDIRPDSYALYKFDIASGKKDLVFSDEGIWGIADFQGDGRWLLSKDTGAIWSEYYEFDTHTKKLTPLFGQGEQEEYFAQYGSRPGEILVLTPKFGEFSRLYRWKKQGDSGNFEPITEDIQKDIFSFDIDLPRRHILFSVNDGGYFRLDAIDAKTFKKVKLPHFPGADHVSSGSITRDGRYMPIRVKSSQSPPISYVYDWTSGRLVQWVVPSAPEMDTRHFALAKLEYYTARDGTPIPMFVRRPSQCQTENSASCPVIVEFHGGPEAQSIPGFNPTSQIYMDAGFVYVAPNVRGSYGYGKTWLTSDNGPKRLDVITDIEDCAKFIKSHWAVNGKAPRVGIMGYSYGGYSTLVGMTRFSGSYDAGVALVGMGNLVTFLNNTAPYRRKGRITEYGDPETDMEALIQLSPVTYIDNIKDPLLIIQGVSDPRVPVGEAVQFYEKLSQRQIPSQLILFGDEGHGAEKIDNQVAEIGHTLLFFQKHLQNKN